MSRRAFNSCTLNGVSIPAGEMITGSGVLDSIGYDDMLVTLNHCIRHVRLAQLQKAQLVTRLDRLDLETQDRLTDDDNFGGTHSFYYDGTLIAEFDGVVSCEYDDDSRLTTIIIKGEDDG